MSLFRLMFGLVTISFGASALATDLTFVGTADDAFTAYVSTDPSTAGTQFASGNSWGTTWSGTATLTNGVTNYLHVDARDLAGPPSMLIASLTLSDSNFYFSTGGQTAFTGDSNWTASLVGFGGTTTTINDLGVNGSGVWGTVAGVGSSAHHVWTDGDVSTHRYFTVAINTVPEPASIAVIGAGLLLLARRRRKA